MFGIPCSKSHVIFSFAKPHFQRLTYSQESWSKTPETVPPRVSSGPGEQFTLLLGHCYITLLISCLLWIVPCRTVSEKDYGLNSARLPKTLLTSRGDFSTVSRFFVSLSAPQQGVRGCRWLAGPSERQYYQIKDKLVFSNSLFHARPSWESWLPAQSFKET